MLIEPKIPKKLRSCNGNQKKLTPCHATQERPTKAFSDPLRNFPGKSKLKGIPIPGKKQQIALLCNRKIMEIREKIEQTWKTKNNNNKRDCFLQSKERKRPVKLRNGRLTIFLFPGTESRDGLSDLSDRSLFLFFSGNYLGQGIKRRTGGIEEYYIEMVGWRSCSPAVFHCQVVPFGCVDFRHLSNPKVNLPYTRLPLLSILVISFYWFILEKLYLLF